MATPAWLAATPKLQANAGAINQFLGLHSSQFVYAGTLASAQATGTGTYQSLQTNYDAQLIFTGSSQTTIGRVALQVATIGGSPTTATIPPLTLSLYASAAGAPTGAALATSSVLEPYVYSAAFWVSIPLYATGLTASAPYWIVTSPAGTASAYYVWQQSNQSSGASTSPDAATWTAQTFGLMYQVYDATASGMVQGLVDDAGARSAWFTWSASGQLTGITEYVAAQGGGALVSTRTVTYASNLPVGVS